MQRRLESYLGDRSHMTTPGEISLPGCQESLEAALYEVNTHTGTDYRHLFLVPCPHYSNSKALKLSSWMQIHAGLKGSHVKN